MAELHTLSDAYKHIGNLLEEIAEKDRQIAEELKPQIEALQRCLDSAINDYYEVLEAHTPVVHVQDIPRIEYAVAHPPQWYKDEYGPTAHPPQIERRVCAFFPPMHVQHLDSPMMRDPGYRRDLAEKTGMTLAKAFEERLVVELSKL